MDTNWIPVEKQLPQHGQEVVFKRDWIIGGATYYVGQFYADHFEAYSNRVVEQEPGNPDMDLCFRDPAVVINAVSHWKPL